jgi:hypothetical protein
MKIKLIALMKKNKSDINSLKYICGSIMKIYIKNERKIIRIKIISSHNKLSNEKSEMKINKLYCNLPRNKVGKLKN